MSVCEGRKSWARIGRIGRLLLLLFCMVVTHVYFGCTVHAKVVTNGLHEWCEATAWCCSMVMIHQVKLHNVSYYWWRRSHDYIFTWWWPTSRVHKRKAKCQSWPAIWLDLLCANRYNDSSMHDASFILYTWVKVESGMIF